MRYTLILVPETAQGSVRKMQVDRAWLRAGAGISLVLLALSLLLVCDYVRARRALVDLPRLRAEGELQSQELRRYGDQFSRIEGELARVREFERKLRVISDLPGAPAGGEPTPGAAVEGLGGGADDAALPAPGATSAGTGGAHSDAGSPGSSGEMTLASLGYPTRPFHLLERWIAPLASAAPVLAPAVVDPEALARWGRLHQAAGRLRGQLGAQNASLEQLAAQLARKVERLAATPSIWPTRGWITSRFGPRVSPFTGLEQDHPGLDIATAPGTPIVASARGKVAFTGERGPLGRSLVLDHGFGVQTTYGHLLDIFVKPGAHVERGQKIASVGNSGRSTGPHLHYALEIHGRLVDPTDYILD